MAIDDLIRRLRKLTPEAIESATASASPIRTDYRSDEHFPTSESYRAVHHYSTVNPVPETVPPVLPVHESTEEVIDLHDAMVQPSEEHFLRAENARLDALVHSLQDALEAEHEELIHARMREVIHVDALTRIAFPDASKISDLHGNPQRWSSTVAYKALGCVIVGGRTHTRDTIPTSANTARLAVRRLRNLLNDIMSANQTPQRLLERASDIISRIVHPHPVTPNMPPEG